MVVELVGWGGQDGGVGRMVVKYVIIIALFLIFLGVYLAIPVFK
jgi:hypothetical protein